MRHFDIMMRMGVWTENLLLSALLNECMLQSYSGILGFSKGGVAGVANPWHPDRATVTALPGGQPVVAHAAEAGVVIRIETTARTVYRVSRA